MTIQCPICEQTPKRWNPGKDPSRDKAFCPECNSKPRHRMQWLYLRYSGKVGSLHEAKERVLHIAPERCLSDRLQEIVGANYVGADLNPARPGVTHSFSLEQIPFPENYFDIILCNHVLEHVADDRAAMAEMARVLKPDGLALLTFPFDRDLSETDEDPSITDPEERTRRFGQYDHVRRYGDDAVQRLQGCGFHVLPLTGRQIAGEGIDFFGIKKNDVLFVCGRNRIRRAGRMKSTAFKPSPAAQNGMTDWTI